MSTSDTHKELYNLSTNEELLNQVLDPSVETRTQPKPLYKKTPSLNTILYGPPGTGKTYHTIEKAISIANPLFVFDGKNRKQIKEEYERLNDEKRIAFCTFHQSMSYEDFVEGIKPSIADTGNKDETIEDIETVGLKYIIEDGIFKQICNNARFKPSQETQKFSISEQDFDKAVFYKMSLGSTQNPDDDEIYEYCINNGYIALGWGDEYDYTGVKERDIIKVTKDYGLRRFETSAIRAFIYTLKIGNYVVVSNGNYQFRAVGRITGEYEYKEDSPIAYSHFRKVDWLIKNVDIPVGKIYDKNFSQQSIYKLNKWLIKKDFFVKSSAVKTAFVSNTPGNYVLIIDEINRGNVSSIFGELITLIEEDKREERSEALSVLLSYSKKKFSIPSNLYIIGTMNTADRSVEALDAALRRRFQFEEMMPDYTSLLNNDGSEKTVSGISLKRLLTTINERISYLLDEDHQIGHSYLCNLKSDDNQGLVSAFKNKIVPLLKEYFFNDHEKIMWILGKSFIEQKDVAPSFASGIKEDTGRVLYSFKDINEENILSALKVLLNES